MSHPEMTPAIAADLAEIRSMLDGMRKADDALWGYKEIGDYCGYSAQIVAKRIVKNDRFPKPRQIPGTKQPRWVAEEVRQYFKSLDRR